MSKVILGLLQDTIDGGGDHGDNPLTFTGDADISFTASPLCNTDVWYKTSNSDWAPYNEGDVIHLKAGDSVSFRNFQTTLGVDEVEHGQFHIYGAGVRASGDIKSMINYAPLSDYCFACLFGNSECPGLEYAPELPDTVLAPYCYSHMFGGSGIILPPILPAEELEPRCYEYMFEFCECLLPLDFGEQYPYILPAMYIPTGAYEGMFWGSSVEGSIDIYGVYFGDNACYVMFHSCAYQYTIASFPMLWCLDELGEPLTIGYDSFYQMYYGASYITDITPFGEITQRLGVVPDNSFYGTFSNCQLLMDAGIIIGGYELGFACFAEMFAGCTSLSHAPQYLEAPAVAPYCYAGMFMSCESITNAPEIWADDWSMCELACANMFSDAYSLEYIRVNFTEWPGDDATADWVSMVSEQGLFEHPAGLEIIRGDSAIPEGWDTLEF